MRARERTSRRAIEFDRPAGDLRTRCGCCGTRDDPIDYDQPSTRCETRCAAWAVDRGNAVVVVDVPHRAVGQRMGVLCPKNRPARLNRYRGVAAGVVGHHLEGIVALFQRADDRAHRIGPGRKVDGNVPGFLPVVPVDPGAHDVPVGHRYAHLQPVAARIGPYRIRLLAVGPAPLGEQRALLAGSEYAGNGHQAYQENQMAGGCFHFYYCVLYLIKSPHASIACY